LESRLQPVSRPQQGRRKITRNQLPGRQDGPLQSAKIEMHLWMIARAYLTGKNPRGFIILKYAEIP
jgi:hypothetical protein